MRGGLGKETKGQKTKQGRGAGKKFEAWHDTRQRGLSSGLNGEVTEGFLKYACAYFKVVCVLQYKFPLCTADIFDKIHYCYKRLGRVVRVWLV